MSSDNATDDAAAASKLTRLRREPPPFRRVAVRSLTPLSAHMVRVVLGGTELDGFAIEAAASSIRLLLPAPDQDHITMPIWTGNQFDLPDGSRAPIRTFTPRAFDAERLELTLDIVLHDRGAATDWARGAAVGDELAISGPGRSEHLDPDADSHLLVGDETALPAIGQLLESIPTGQAIDVHVEITAPDARIDLPDHPLATVVWHDATAGSVPGDAMVEAVLGLDVLPDAIWIAGEAASVQRLRKYLFDARGRDRSTVTARGYWKHGRSAT